MDSISHDEEVAMQNTPAESELVRLPAMHPVLFAQTLRDYAARCPEDQTIVEVGAWLGAGTYHLADASTQPLHVFDNWLAKAGEVVKAQDQGEFGLIVGESYLHVVQHNLRKFGDQITYNQGDLRRAEYMGGPIGLYVDDASKHSIETILPRFEKHFAPGCILILMDYYWHRCGPQRDFIEASEYEFVERPDTYKTVAIWRVPE